MMKRCQSCGAEFFTQWRNEGEDCPDCLRSGAFSAWRNGGQLLGSAATLEGAVLVASRAIPQHHPKPSGDDVSIMLGTHRVLSFPETRTAPT